MLGQARVLGTTEIERLEQGHMTLVFSAQRQGQELKDLLRDFGEQLGQRNVV